MLDQLFHNLAQHGTLAALALAWLGGLALNLTPCVYPMIPVTIAFFSGQATGHRKGHVAWLGLCYVLGISLMYALLGFAAAKTGALLGSWLQHPAVLIGTSLLIALLALSMFGAYEFRAPSALTRFFGEAKIGTLGAFVMGLAVGVVAAPCIGPFVLGLMVFVSQAASPVTGFALFFFMGLGMGLPYIVLGLFADRLSHLPRAGAWLVWVKNILGCVLVGVALYLVRSMLPAGARPWLLAVSLAMAGLYLGWLERSRLTGRWRWLQWGLGIGLICAAIAGAPQRQVDQPRVVWTAYASARLAAAREAHQPVVIDVYADWCVPCVELDHVTFRHPDVVARLGTFATLRIDATTDVSEDAQGLLDDHRVYGVPTVLLFDANGVERADLRIMGFASPTEFLQRLESLASPPS